jgi:(1->4)-alpha-D-glucan 1-alpha-D-glucosylmutase
VVEKILEPEEDLPADWPVSGTTGYDFLNRVGGLFVDPAGEKPMTDLYSDITCEMTDFKEIVRLKKHRVLAESFISEINRLTAQLMDIRTRHRRYRDLTRVDLSQALQEVIACFPVYRTYICAVPEEVAQEDVETVEAAVATARSKRRTLDELVWEFFKDLLLLRLDGRTEADFVMRFQQLTGPAMAKGVEDTAFYCFNRLISLNEVGGDPSRFGVSIKAFHRFCRYLQTHWPQTMLTTATHDTKRGEDTRLRIHLLSEIPEKWSDKVQRWFGMNAAFHRDGFPDPNTEYFLYQTLVGAWPISLKRLQTYMEKAVREAKVHTSWTQPNERYESILKRFVKEILVFPEFIDDLTAFIDPLIEPARISSLSQSLIRLTAPGIPDIYQGTELWDLSLVDPDNRRPVDYVSRQKLLEELEGLAAKAVMSRLDEGLPKLFTIQTTLSVRHRYPEVFGPESTYRPLSVEGIRSNHAVAFIRKERIATVAPCRLLGLDGGWGDTTFELPEGAWYNVFTQERLEGGKVAAAVLLAQFPIGLFVKEG